MKRRRLTFDEKRAEVERLLRLMLKQLPAVKWPPGRQAPEYLKREDVEEALKRIRWLHLWDEHIKRRDAADEA